MDASRTPSVAPAWAARLAAGIREEWAWLVGGLLLVGLLLVVLGITGWQRPDAPSGLFGCFLLVYGSLVFLQSAQSALLGDALKQRLQQAIASSGAGFYGVVSLSRFLQLELHDVLEGLGDFSLRGQFTALFRDWLIGFSVDSLTNTINAALWPFTLIAAHRWPAVALIVLPMWALYRLGGWVFPELQRLAAAEGKAGSATAGSTSPSPTVPPPPPR